MSRDFRLLAAICVVFVCLPLGALSKCLDDQPEVSPKRHFYMGGQSWPVTIETSERPSHLLVSHVVQILLKEVLGYAKVSIQHGPNTMNTTQILERLSECSGNSCRTSQDGAHVPDAMLNLEVWSSAGFNVEPWIQEGQIKDGGPLGPSGRFGWYLPSWLVNETWHSHHSIIDHWRALQRSHVTRKLQLVEDVDLLWPLLARTHEREHRTYCEDETCQEGILHTGHCLRHRDKCGLLLSSYPEQDLGILRNQIDALNLSVSVTWIGKHLHRFVVQRTRNLVPTLFFNWVPNTLTALNEFTRIAFPACDVGDEASGLCDFDVHQLSKFMWARLETHAPELYHVVSKMRFTQQQYEDLLRLHTDINPEFTNSEAELVETACQWVRNNKNLWRTWIPKNLSNKTKIYVGGMFPKSGPYWRDPGIAPGAMMAVDYINSNTSILKNYELVLKSVDTKCLGDIAMKQFMQFISNDVHRIAGIIGPACSDIAVPIAGLAKHFNTIVISYGADALKLGNRKLFPLFFRTKPSMGQFAPVLIELFKRYNWRQVALISEEAQEFPDYKNFLKDHYLNNKINVVYDRKIPHQTPADQAQKYVTELRSTGARIIVLTSFAKSARAVLCHAYKAGMTGQNGYVWFLPNWFTHDWWNTEYFNAEEAENVPCTTGEMLLCIQGHMTLDSGFIGPENSVIVSNMTVLEWSEEYVDIMTEQNLQDYLSTYATYAHDAMWLFALGLDRLLSEDPSALESLHTESTTRKLMSHLNETRFTGVSGTLHFVGAERKGIIDIQEFTGNESRRVGRYVPERPASERLVLNDSFIIWPNGSVPSDGTPEPKKCSVEKFRAVMGVDCDYAIVIANIIGVASFGLTMLVSLIFVKKRYDSKVRATRERMEELGLMQDPSWRTLDHWEVARDRVVLNRKLGEGAFGTVYGGEAFIDDHWLGVAVKTLKIGSNPEEKLDFLSETEMMKRFDHDNIVKLLGVCTRGEPAYTIMEFMLHGDLKTFLVARRQLVGQNSKEAEDVTPERLTNMARDIAAGLKYLTDIKFVHRDLACRNCLVHASKKVKIGDFGMARPIYDSDYYRFNKRGMLPVRWMAPESLTDGVFTAASDIWSFGVLLYEIVTFGSFPYQGMSNKQVLEAVKAGQSITLPTVLSEELQETMTACWTFDPIQRPSVNHILELLTCSPCLVQPCLDAPRTVVALVTDSVEVSLPPARSRCSRLQLRTQSEHSQIRSSTCGGSGTSSNRMTMTSDPFHIPELSTSSGQSKRFSTSSVIRAPTTLSDLDRRISSASDEVDCPLTQGCRECRECRDTGCGQTTTDSSPGTPNTLGRLNAEERGDSDYCSDNSKEFPHALDTSAV